MKSSRPSSASSCCSTQLLIYLFIFCFSFFRYYFISLLLDFIAAKLLDTKLSSSILNWRQSLITFKTSFNKNIYFSVTLRPEGAFSWGLYNLVSIETQYSGPPVLIDKNLTEMDSETKIYYHKALEFSCDNRITMTSAASPKL